MQSCKECGVNYGSLHYEIDRDSWFCSAHYQRPMSRYEANVMVELKDGKTLSSAHYKDILSRKALPDGSVIRDTKKVYI